MKALVANRALLSRTANLLTNHPIGAGLKISTIPVSTLTKNEILVKISATSLNPIDAKFVDVLAPSGSILGCDFAGTVADAGSSSWRKGDRVAGFVQGGISSDIGAFADYVKADEDLVWRVPESVRDEEAATYGIVAGTAMQALKLHLGIWWNQDTKKEHTGGERVLLVYSGATSVGLFAIQMAKRAGWTVVTTASPRSFDLVKRYGADHIYDYRTPSAAQDIKKAFPHISRALDCISIGESTKFCGQVLGGNTNAKVITLLDSKTKVPGVEVKMIMSFQMLGKEFAWLPPIGPKFPVSREDRDALVQFYAELGDIVGEVKSPPVTVLDGGFDGIIKGLDKLRKGTVSGSKLVVKY
ncbi:putative ToxD-like zinc binding oxidoreductase [Paraphoma chrysanthemicola]|uniref:ToxD-like zinc binding oxidoreductase n=1 Tax=Paraphoma chrysanthemicola TaxID=798071 RepID=A0A8K0W557_9PLEO|nr:putative ToxD-like zinc binding oxidoreductase [Paraphoma chrysanthemicola]